MTQRLLDADLNSLLFKVVLIKRNDSAFPISLFLCHSTTVSIFLSSCDIFFFLTDSLLIPIVIPIDIKEQCVIHFHGHSYFATEIF